MRLVGGNISDTPVKEIGDGSAFYAGGGGVVAKLLSGATTATRLTSMDNFEPNSLSVNRMMGCDVCEVAAGASSDKWCMVYRSDADDKVKAIIIDFDSDGAPTEGVQRDLDAFSTVATGAVQVYRVSDSKVMVLSHRLNGTNLEAELQLYDISGTSMTASSNGRQTVTWRGGGNRPNDIGPTQMLILDGDRLVLAVIDRLINSDSRIRFIGVRFTATQAQSSWFDSSYTGAPHYKPSGYGGRMVPNGAGKFLTHDYWSTFSWNYSAASTPIVSLDAEISSTAGSEFGTAAGYQKDEHHFMRNTTPADNAEYMSDGEGYGFRYYSGSTDNEITRFAEPGGFTTMDGGAGSACRRTRLVAIDGDNWHVLKSQVTGTTHQHAMIVCNVVTSDTIVGPTLDVTPTMDCPAQHMGTVIVPRNNPEKASIYGYQDASTAGWYRYTINIST